MTEQCSASTMQLLCCENPSAVHSTLLSCAVCSHSSAASMARHTCRLQDTAGYIHIGLADSARVTPRNCPAMVDFARAKPGTGVQKYQLNEQKAGGALGRPLPMLEAESHSHIFYQGCPALLQEHHLAVTKWQDTACNLQAARVALYLLKPLRSRLGCSNRKREHGFQCSVTSHCDVQTLLARCSCLGQHTLFSLGIAQHKVSLLVELSPEDFIEERRMR